MMPFLELLMILVKFIDLNMVLVEPGDFITLVIC